MIQSKNQNLQDPINQQYTLNNQVIIYVTDFILFVTARRANIFHYIFKKFFVNPSIFLVTYNVKFRTIPDI